MLKKINSDIEIQLERLINDILIRRFIYFNLTLYLCMCMVNKKLKLQNKQKQLTSVDIVYYY